MYLHICVLITVFLVRLIPVAAPNTSASGNSSIKLLNCISVQFSTEFVVQYQWVTAVLNWVTAAVPTDQTKKSCNAIYAGVDQRVCKSSPGKARGGWWKSDGAPKNGENASTTQLAATDRDLNVERWIANWNCERVQFCLHWTASQQTAISLSLQTRIASGWR